MKKRGEADLTISVGRAVAEASRKIRVTGQTRNRLWAGYSKAADRPCAAAQDLGDRECIFAASGGRPDTAQPDFEGGGAGRLLTASHLRHRTEQVIEIHSANAQLIFRVGRASRSPPADCQPSTLAPILPTKTMRVNMGIAYFVIWSFGGRRRSAHRRSVLTSRLS